MAAAALCALPRPAYAAPIHRIVAVGDLHGDFAAWRAIAQAAGLLDGAGRWIGGDTVLVQTGDVVDRGPDSRKLIEELMRLKREAPPGQCVFLVGNHEAMNVVGDLRYLVPADYQAFTDADSAKLRDAVYEANKTAIIAANRAHDPTISEDAVKQAWLAATPLGSIERRIAWSPTGPIGSWVIGNPALALIDGNLFLHGGISPAYARMTLAEINAKVAAALKADATDPKAIINDPEGPLWYRGLAQEAVPPPVPQAGPAPPTIAQQLDMLLRAFGAKRIVIGHTP
ncbi:MAG: metallophosphoesterase, partial [Alphaproteobacteria bacterium]|nr:metallophosphoesterase [Alphaproteobacteria bacterium]